MKRIAISNLAWPDSEDVEALSTIASYGYTGLEIAPVKVFGPLALATRKTVDDYHTRARDLGLPIVAMQAILFGVQNASLFGGDAERSALKIALVDVARVSGWLGGIPCVFGAPKLRDRGALGMDEAQDIAVAFFRDIAPVFSDQGSTLCFEANPVIYGCNFITHTDEACELVKTVASDGFSLNFDTGTAIANDEDAGVISRALSIACHIHISEPHLSPVKKASRHDMIAQIVAQSAYCNEISVEMKSDRAWDGNVLGAFSIAKRYASVNSQFND